MVKRILLAAGLVLALCAALYFVLACSYPAAPVAGSSIAQGMHEYTLKVEADSTGWVTETGPIVLGKLYAVSWDTGTYSTSSLLGIAMTVSVQGPPVAQDLLKIFTPTTNSDAIYYPRVAQHDTTGVAVTSTAVSDWEQPLLNGALQVVVRSVDTDTLGYVTFYWEE